MRLAVLDDNIIVCDHIVRLLSEEGHHVDQFLDAKSLLMALRRDSFDLLLVDWTLPESSGVDVLKWVRENLNPTPPMIMVTAKTRDEEIIAGLSEGADDYIIKPFQDDVFKARVGAILRRFTECSATKVIEHFGRHTFDASMRTVTLEGSVIESTPKEFALALLLFRNLHRPLSRNYIMESVWGYAPDMPSRTLDAHISQIRKRLGLLPENSLRLSSVYGFGYRLERTKHGSTPLEAKAA